MRMVRNFNFRTLLRPLLLAPLLVLPACDDGDDDDYDHDPVAGYGGLIVDNETISEVRVYLDNEKIFHVEDFDEKDTDVRPGTYRLRLDEVDGPREDSRYIEIVEGLNTVVEIKADPYDYDDYDVDVFLD